jgi:PleD family two-component response regulator
MVNLAHLMDGDLWLQSPGIDRGTTASLSFNLQRLSRDTKQSIISRGNSVSTLRGMRVLVVDDNSINRLVTAKMLQKLECIPTTVESGEACLQLLEAETIPFDLCFMDLSMPGLDGFQTTTKILVEEVIPYIRISVSILLIVGILTFLNLGLTTYMFRIFRSKIAQ